MMQCWLMPCCDDTKCFFTTCNPWFYVLCVSWVNRVPFNSLLLSSHFCIKQWNVLWLWKIFCHWNKTDWWLSLPPVCLCRIWVKLRSFRNVCPTRTQCCYRCWSQGSQFTLAIAGLRLLIMCTGQSVLDCCQCRCLFRHTIWSSSRAGCVSWSCILWSRP